MEYLGSAQYKSFLPAFTSAAGRFCLNWVMTHLDYQLIHMLHYTWREPVIRSLFGFLEGETIWTLQSSDKSVALQDRIISDVRKVWKIVLCLNNLLWENSDYMKHMKYVDWNLDDIFHWHQDSKNEQLSTRKANRQFGTKLLANKFSRNNFFLHSCAIQGTQPHQKVIYARNIDNNFFDVQFNHIKCLVPNCPDAKLSVFNSWCQIVRC